MDFNGLYFAAMISLLIAIFTGLSISLFITFIMLNKFNDYGDYSCSIEEYSQLGINYRLMKDNIGYYEKNDYFFIYAENPYENTDRAIPDQLLKNTREARDESEDEF